MRTWQDPNTGETFMVSEEEYQFMDEDYSQRLMGEGIYSEKAMNDRIRFIETRERELDDTLRQIETEKRAVVDIQRNVHKRENVIAAQEAGLAQVELDLRKKLEDFRIANAKILTAIDDAVALMEVEEPAEALALMKTMQEKLDIKW